MVFQFGVWTICFLCLLIWNMAACSKNYALHGTPKGLFSPLVEQCIVHTRAKLTLTQMTDKVNLPFWKGTPYQVIRTNGSLFFEKLQHWTISSGVLSDSFFIPVEPQLQPLPSNVAIRQVSPPLVHGEGPHWDCGQQLLYAVDITGQKVHRYRPSDGQFLGIKLDGPVSPVVPVLGSLTQLLVGVGRDLMLLDAHWGPGEPRPARDPFFLASVDEDKPGNRLNDGKADRLGRLWVGTMGPEPVVGQVTPGRGSLYRVEREPNGELAIVVTPKETNLDISNGMAWDAAETRMYYIDTPRDRVDVFDFDLDNGNISNRRSAFDFKTYNVSGHPDGMTIDSEGNLWIACFDGWQVIKIEPTTGRLLQRVPMPVSRVTSVAFGGSSLDTLYVTSMRLGLTEEQLKQQPAAGSIFAVTGLGVRGKPPGGRKVRLPPIPTPPPTQPPLPTPPATPPQQSEDDQTQENFPETETPSSLEMDHNTRPVFHEEHGEESEEEHEEHS